MSDFPDIKVHNVSGNQQPGSSNHINDSYNIYFSQCTQDELENNIDVMWDWNSPQSKPRIRKYKRSDIQQSPKLPIKRQPSNNQIDGFNKLREELETLRDHIVENIDTGTVSNALHTETNSSINARDLEDVFNDSMEQQLLVCSQEAENKCINEKPLLKHRSLRNFDKTLHSPEYINQEPCSKNSGTVVRDHSNNQPNNTFNRNKIADDSFDFILETLKDEDLEFSEPLILGDARETSCKQTEGQYTDDTLKCTAQEIEQKRKEALSKLEGKKKQIAYEVESPIKCSPEEIEQKRLQAIAKLEAKKKDVIERNRLQAVKRLEENKRRRALNDQTSLPRKIHNANI